MISIRCGKETLIFSNFWAPKDIYSQRIYNARHRKYNFAQHQQGKRQVQLVNPTPTLESFKRPVITCSNSWILRHNPNEKYNERDQLAPVWKALIKKSRERNFKKKKMAGKKKWCRGWLEKGKPFMLHLAHKWLQPQKEQERSALTRWKLSNQAMWPTQLQGYIWRNPGFKETSDSRGHCSTIYNTLPHAAHRTSTDTRVQRKWSVNMMERDSATQKKERTPFARTSFYPGVILLSEVSQNQNTVKVTANT